MVIKSEAQQNVEKLKEKLLPILEQHQVSRAGIFGSTVEGTARETSDVDLLIEFRGEKSLFDLVALRLDLEAEINRHIDILTYRALNPLIKKGVLAKEVKIL
jgi:predicted nucleotidyltransferase